SHPRPSCRAGGCSVRIERSGPLANRTARTLVRPVTRKRCPLGGYGDRSCSRWQPSFSTGPRTHPKTTLFPRRPFRQHRVSVARVKKKLPPNCRLTCKEIGAIARKSGAMLFWSGESEDCIAGPTHWLHCSATVLLKLQLYWAFMTRNAVCKNESMREDDRARRW